MTTVTEGIIAPHDAKMRRALLCFATSACVDSYGQGSSYRLSMAGADLSILNGGRAPLLDGHLRELDSVLGVVETAWIEGTQAWCIARFASHAKALNAWNMVQERIVTNVSMGFSHPAVDPGDDGQQAIPSWRPFEVSLCAVPANWTAGVLPQPQQTTLDAVVDAAEERSRRALATSVQAAFREQKLEWAAAIAPGVATRLGTDPEVTARAIAEAAAA